MKSFLLVTTLLLSQVAYSKVTDQLASGILKSVVLGEGQITKLETLMGSTDCRGDQKFQETDKTPKFQKNADGYKCLSEEGCGYNPTYDYKVYINNYILNVESERAFSNYSNNYGPKYLGQILTTKCISYAESSYFESAAEVLEAVELVNSGKISGKYFDCSKKQLVLTIDSSTNEIKNIKFRDTAVSCL